MWLSRLRDLLRGPRCPRQPAPKPPRRRLLLEPLEERSLPSTFTAGSVADLIADINAANAAGGSNTIVLAANTTFDLTAVNNTSDGANGLPVIANKHNLTISGQGGDIIQRDTAAPAFRLFDVATHGSLMLANLTLQNGLAFGSGSAAEGGAVYNQGSLIVNGATVQNNTAQGSDGTYHQQHVINGNDAAGGAIWSNGTLTLGNGTVIQSNKAVGGFGGYGGGSGGNAWGGGLYIAGGTANVSGVTVNSNGAQGGSGFVCSSGPCYSPDGNGGSASGGGLFVAGGSVTLTSDLLENNSAAGGSGGPGGNGFGGGLYADGGATVSLCGDTVVLNAAYGGAFGSVPPVGQAEGGGIYIAPKATVYLDAFTVANALNNTDSSGTNGSTANIDGSYVLQPC